MATPTSTMPVADSKQSLPNSPHERDLGSLAKFPAEVRDAIYGYVLLWELDIYPYQYSSYYKRSVQRPDIALFFVNKQINIEASSILYTYATFHITTGPDFDQFFDGHVYNDRRCIRYVCLIFKAEPSTPSAITIRNNGIWYETRFKATTRSQRMEAAHDHDMHHTEMKWISAADTLGSMALYANLKTLVLDLSDIVCGHGCCRLYDVFVSIFGNWLFFAKDKVSIDVKGRFTADELERIEGVLPKAKFVV